MGSFIVLGVVTGGVYALFALGIVLMYQTTGVVNIAFGALGVLAAYTFQSLSGGLPSGVAFGAVLVASLAAGAALGVITLPARFASVATKSVSALGLMIAIPALVAVAWGTDIKPTPFLTRSVAFRAFGVAVTTQQVITFSVAVVGAGALIALFRLGPIGAALRAMSSDVRTAQLVGLPVRGLWVLSWTLATFAAGLAAMLVIPATSMSIQTITFVVLTPLAAALAAQFRHAGIALAAAMSAGIAEGVLAGSAQWSAARGLVPLTVALIGTACYGSTASTRWERV